MGPSLVKTEATTVSKVTADNVNLNSSGAGMDAAESDPATSSVNANEAGNKNKSTAVSDKRSSLINARVNRWQKCGAHNALFNARQALKKNQEEVSALHEKSKIEVIALNDGKNRLQELNESIQEARTKKRGEAIVVNNLQAKVSRRRELLMTLAKAV